MAKSYITKFTEYAKECKDKLKAQLKNKGLEVLENDTLDTLVNRVSNITPPPVPTAVEWGYTRDSALPDLDKEFDEDLLREVNGGEYRSCAYIVAFLYDYNSVENQQNIAVYGNSSYPCKMVFGKSGREISITTTSYSFTVNEDEIYTLSDGGKVYVIKLYSDYARSGTSYSYYRAFSSISNLYYLELICDNTQSSPSSSSYATSYNYDYYNSIAYTKYLRFVAPIHDDMYFTSFDSPYVGIGGTIRIDGDFNTSSLFIYNKDIEIILNGSYIGTSQLIAIGSVNTSSTSPSYKIPIVRKIVAPSISQKATYYGKMKLIICTQLTSDGILIIPEGYSSSSSSSSYASSSYYYSYYYNPIIAAATLHLPSSYIIKSIIEKDKRPLEITCINVRNLTVDEGFGGANETALTLEAPYYMPLLTLESINNLVENLADRTDKEANTIKFNKYQQTLLTEEQLETLANKNWTVTFAF